MNTFIISNTLFSANICKYFNSYPVYKGNTDFYLFAALIPVLSEALY